MRRLITQWWRPMTCVWISGTMLVHGVVIPLWTKTPAELSGLSLLISACAAAFAVREWGKIKGTAE